MKMRDFGRLWRKRGIKDGQPCLDGTGILVEAVADRFAAGESIADIAEDFSASPQTIEAAIRLVVYARGTNLDEARAAKKVALEIPLL